MRDKSGEQTAEYGHARQRLLPMTSQDVRFLVVGAGPTGIGAAAHLTELGEEHLLVEAGPTVGGMAGSIRDRQGFVWDLGGHVSDSRFPEFDAAVGKSGVELVTVRGNAAVWHGGRLAAAPIDPFRYPVGGTGALWTGVQDALLEPARVELGTAVVHLDLRRRLAYLSSGHKVSYQYCISSAPLTELLDWIGEESTARRLRASGVLAVGLGFTGAAPQTLADKVWLRCPDEQAPWHRATVLSNCEPSLAGANRWSILLEIPIVNPRGFEPEQAIRDTVTSLRPLGVDPQALVTEWHRPIRYGYPVPTPERDAVLRQTDELLRAGGVYSRGRFGGWRSESGDQDWAYVQGRQAVDHVLYGDSEDVYWHIRRL